GCGSDEQEADGNWRPAWRDTRRRFKRNAHADLDADHPSADAGALIHERKGQGCPWGGGPGRGGSGGGAGPQGRAQAAAGAARRKNATRTQERSRREQARRPAESGERRAASSGNPPPLVPTVPGNPYRESWTYVGTKRCKTFEPPGAAPRIICP